MKTPALAVLVAVALGLLAAGQFRDVAPAPRPAIVLPVSGQTITLPDGDVTLTAPLRLADLDKATLRGGANTRLLYAGPPTRAVVEFARCGNCRLVDVDIVVQVAGVDAAVLMTNLPGDGGGRVSTGNVCERVRVMPVGSPPKRSFSVDSFAAGGADGNNDDHRFQDCWAWDYSECGYYVDGPQCHNCSWRDCYTHGMGLPGTIGLWAKGCVFGEWRGGGMQSNSEADFKLGGPGTKWEIYGCDSENSRQFLATDRSGAGYPISIHGVRWDGRPVAGVPIIDCYGPVSCEVRQCGFSGINGTCPTLRFDSWSGPAAQIGAVDWFGVTVRQHGGTGSPGIIATVPVRWEVRSTGFRYQCIKADGSRVYKMGLWNRVIQ